MTIQGKYGKTLDFYQSDSEWGFIVRDDEDDPGLSIDFFNNLAPEVALRVLDCAGYSPTLPIMVEVRKEVTKAKAKQHEDELIRHWATEMGISVCTDTPIPYKVRQEYKKQKKYWADDSEC